MWLFFLSELPRKKEQRARQKSYLHSRFATLKEADFCVGKDKVLTGPIRVWSRERNNLHFSEMDVEAGKHPILNKIGANLASCFAAVLYGTCSVSIAFINKFLMTTLEFDYPVFIMIIQMLFTIVLLEILSWFGVIEMPRYTLERGKMFAFPALFYGLNSVLALSALSHMNIALYGVLKRCVPMVTMILSVVILKKGWPSVQTIGSVIFLTVGCIIAGMNI